MLIRWRPPIRRITTLLTVLALPLQPLLPFPAQAGPVGEQVIQGSAEFARAGSLTTIQVGDGSIIQYESFDIAREETVRFIQPGASARVLNRILGDDPTRFEGSLFANGQVYFVNPAGFFVGANALIDVAGLYAAAGSMSNEDFLQRIDRFTALQGPVENLGTIQAEFVHLLGQRVVNQGSIVAQGGIVTLTAGEDVFIAEVGGRILIRLEGRAEAPPVDAGTPGVDQSGEIDARGGRVILTAGDLYSLAIRHPGRTRADDILLEGGEGGVLNVAGMLDASDDSFAASGGRIELRGERIALVGARLDASGDAGGGEVLVGGDLHGAGEGRNASDTFFSADSEIRADALRAGNGGKVVLWADGSTRSYGQISARGGLESGDGGLVETSGRRSLAVDAAPDVSAPHGRGGDWLLDPADITIVDTAPAEGDPLAPDFSATASPSFVTDDAIEAALDAGTNVTISTSFPDGDGAGNITVQASIEKATGTPAASLALHAANDIKVNAPIVSNGGALRVELFADDPLQAAEEGLAGQGVGILTIDAPIRTAGGVLLLGAGTRIDVNQDIDTAGGAAVFGVNSETSARIELGADVSTAGGLLWLQRDTTLDSPEIIQNLDAGTGVLRADGQLTKVTSGDLQLDGATIDLNRSVLVDGSQVPGGADILIGTLGGVTLLQLAGDLRSAGGDIEIGDDFDLDGSNQRIDAGSGELLVDGAIRKTSGGNLDLLAESMELVDGVEVLGGSLSIDTDDLALEGDLFASGDLEVTLDSELVADGISLEAGADLFIDADVELLEGDLLAESGSIEITGVLLLEDGELIAGKDLSLGSGVTLAGAIIADLTAGSLTAETGDIFAGGSLILRDEGSIEASEGSIEIGGSVTLESGGLFAEEEILIGGSATVTDGDIESGAGEIVISGNATIIGGGSLIAESALRVLGSATVGGVLVESGSADIAGSLTTEDDVEVAGDLDVGNALDVGGALLVEEAVRAGSNVDVFDEAEVGSLEAGGTLDVGGELIASGTVSAGGDILLADDVSAAGVISLNGDIEIDGLAEIGAGGILAFGNIILGDEVATAEGDIRTTIGDIDLEAEAAIDGDLVAGGDLFSSETLTARNIEAGGSIEFDGFVGAEGDIVAGGDISISEGVETGGALQAGGSIEIDGGDSTIGAGIQAGEDLDLSGGLGSSIEVAGADVTAEGDITIDMETLVENRIVAGGELESSATLVAGGLESTDGSVTLSATTAIEGSILAEENVILQGDDDVAVEVEGDIDARGEVQIAVLTEVEGEIRAGGGITLDAQVEAGRIEAEDGDVLTFAPLTVSGELVAAGDVLALEPLDPTAAAIVLEVGSIQAGGVVEVQGLLIVEDALVAAGDVRVVQPVNQTAADVFLEAGSIDTGGGVEVQGALIVEDALVAAGDVRVVKPVSPAAADVFLEAGSIDVEGDVVVEGSAEVEGTVDIEGDLVAASDLALASTASIGGGLAVGRDAELSEDTQVGGDAEFVGTLRLGGNLDVAGNLTLQGDTELSGSLGPALGRDQRIVAGGVLLIHDVEKTSAGRLSLQGGTITFNSAVRAQGDLQLAATGTSSRIDGATLVKEGGDLELASATGSIGMQADDRLFVSGDLRISAPGGSAALADIAVGGILSVDAVSVQLLGTKASTGAGAGFETKEGDSRVNYFADKYDFAVTPFGSNQVFGARKGLADVIGAPLTGFDVILTGGVLSVPGEPIPNLSAGEINRESGDLIPPAVPVDAPIIQQLAQVGAERPLWPDELVAFLNCAALAQCEPGAPTAASDVRLTRAAAQTAVLLYRELFLDLEPLRAALQAAVNGFRMANPGQPISGAQLRIFLASRPDHAEAAAHLDRLGTLFRTLERIEMTESEPRATWLEILERVRPNGIDLESLDSAVRTAALAESPARS